MKNWNELSITDKNDIIKVAVQNGITTLPEIRKRYNEFAEGGDIVVPTNENIYAEGGSIHIKPYVLQGKTYYRNGGVLEGDFDVEDISDEEIRELGKLGYIVEIL